MKSTGTWEFIKKCQLYLKWLTNKVILYKRTLLIVMWQPGLKGSLGENGYIYLYGWVPLLSTWSYHNIVNQLDPNIKQKGFFLSSRKETSKIILGDRDSLAFCCCFSVTKLCLTLCDPCDLWTGTARLPCLSLSPGVCSNSCPLSRWCYPIISSSVTPFSSCAQPFPASGSVPMSWLFTSDGQSNGASASASVLPTNIVALWCDHSLRDGERRKNTKPLQKAFKSKERKFPRLAGYSNQSLLIRMSPV